MTAGRSGDRPVPFTTTELEDVPGIGADELAAEARLGRELQSTADRMPVTLSAGFADRVMAAVAAEPVPAPARAAGVAIQAASLRRLLASIRDAFRVSFGAGFPMVARVQALALVLVVVAAAGGGTMGAASALGVFNAAPSPSTGPETPAPVASDNSTVSPPIEATPSPSPEPAESEEPSGSLEPAETDEPGASAGATDDGSATASPSDDHGGASTPRPTVKPTPRPTDTPRPTRTPSPSPTQSDDHGGDSGTPRPSDTPKPSDTPHP